MGGATHDDAMVLLGLATLSAEAGVREAGDFVFSDRYVSDPGEFAARFPRGSSEHGHVVALARHYETIGALLKHGLIDRDLLFDWVNIAAVWARLEAVMLAQREESGDPRLWENFQAAAEQQRAADGEAG